MSTLYIIDGHAYLHRAYHALPPLTTSQGQPVNAIYGFVRMLWKIIQQEKPNYLAVCFDTPVPTFRHVAYAEYKATRKEMDDALKSQMPLARDAVTALNLATFELDGYEADDVIAYLTRQGQKQGWDVVIVSADKDALQLVNDKVKVLSEPKNILYDAEKVRERYGLPPEQLPDYFALIGDSSDNVPGVPGIGPKTAVKLIQDYGDLEAVLKAAPTIKGKSGTLLQSFAEDARQSRSLVVLDKEVPLKISWKECALKPPNVDSLAPFLKRMEFYSLLDEIIPPSQTSKAHTPGKYTSLLTEDALKTWVQKTLQEKRLAVSIMTSSPEPLRATLLGFSFSSTSGKAVYLPVSGGIGAQTLSLETVTKYLQDVFNSPHVQMIGHDLKYIQQVLRRHGLNLSRLYCDTMVASYVLNPSRSGHDLKDLILEMFGDRISGLDQLVGKGVKRIPLDQVPLEKLTDFACTLADQTLRLADYTEKQIKEKQLSKLFFDVEMPLVNVLTQMETAGIRIDRAYLEDLGKTQRLRLDELEKKIYDLAGEPFNINSPKQLSTILFEKLKLPVVRRTKTGFSTDEEVLQTLSASHALPATLIEFRELQKMQSTYVVGLQEGLLLGEDRIHTTFNQTVAATGRLSSSNPNLQNIPIRSEVGRQIRRAFIPETGSVFLSADYSQIDLRVLAHVSQDKALCQAFRQGEDIHAMTAGDIFSVKLPDVTSDMRRAAKAINFGIVYGMSAYGLSQQLQIPAEKAKEYIDRYFERYPGVKTWIDNILKEAREKGYVKTLLGRIRYLPEILSKNTAVRGFAERTAMNTPIQGTSADIIKLAMLRLAESHQKGEWQGTMLVQVHDDLLFEIKPTELERSQKHIKCVMEQALPLSIPIVVDLKTGTNWADLKPIS